MELNVIPDMQTLTALAVATAVIAYGLVQVAKTFLKGWEKQMSKQAPWFWNGVVRLSSLVVGGLSGGLLITATGGDWTWGVCIGLGGGAFSSAIVAIVKKVIRAKGGTQ